MPTAYVTGNPVECVVHPDLWNKTDIWDPLGVGRTNIFEDQYEEEYVGYPIETVSKITIFISGPHLERVRRVRPHPSIFGSGCIAPLLITNSAMDGHQNSAKVYQCRPKTLFVNLSTKISYKILSWGCFSAISHPSCVNSNCGPVK